MKVAELQNIVAEQGVSILGLTRTVENLTKVITALQTQIAGQVIAPAPVPPCECERVTCEECLTRALNATPLPAKRESNKLTPAPAIGSAPANTADFVSVMLPYLVTRAKHNIAGQVDCQTERLQGYDGVTDYRVFLTRKERALYKQCFKNAKLTGKDACIALAGACERAGLKIAIA